MDAEKHEHESERCLVKRTVLEEVWEPCEPNAARVSTPAAASVHESTVGVSGLEAATQPEAIPGCGCPTRRVVEDYDRSAEAGSDE